jgi:hypothetical protein
VDAPTFTKQAESFKQTLSARKLMATDGGIHATRHQNVRSVLQNIKKNCVGPFRTKDVECWHLV